MKDRKMNTNEHPGQGSDTEQLTIQGTSWKYRSQLFFLRTHIINKRIALNKYKAHEKMNSERYYLINVNNKHNLSYCS